MWMFAYKYVYHCVILFLTLLLSSSLSLSFFLFRVTPSAATTRVLSQILTSVMNIQFSLHNPYTPSILTGSVTAVREPDFRPDAVKYYQLSEIDMLEYGMAIKGDNTPLPLYNLHLTPCMLTGLNGNSQQVKAAHLLPHHTPLDTLRHVGMSAAEVNSARNCLLLCAGIELAFDQLLCSFVPAHPLSPNGPLILRIWKEEARQMPVWPEGQLFIDKVRGKKALAAWTPAELTIGEYEGKVLNITSPSAYSSSPCRRALSYQAHCAYKIAVLGGYVSEGGPGEYVDLEFGSRRESGVATPFQSMRETVGEMTLEQQEELAGTEEEEEYDADATTAVPMPYGQRIQHPTPFSD
jgi:hypothetical protein